MPVVKLPAPQMGMSLEALTNLMFRYQRELQYVLDGHLDEVNVSRAQTSTDFTSFVSGTYATDAGSFQTQLDGKIETYYTDTDPNTWGSQNATFARASVAYKQDGSEVASGVARYETGQFSSAIMVEEGCANIIAAYPTGWALSGAGMAAVDQGVQVGAAGNTVRLTNSAATEGNYHSPLFALSPSTTYTVRFKVRGTVGASKFDVYIISNTGTLVQSVSPGIPVTGSFVVKTVTFTTTADITGTNQYIRFDHNGNDAGYIEIAEISLIQKAYALTFPGYGATRAAEILTILTAGVFTKGSATAEFIFEPTSIQAITGKVGVLFYCIIDANNIYSILIHESGRVYLQISSGGVSVNTYHASDPVLTVGSKYHIGFKINGSTMSCWVNGVKGAKGDVAYTEPVGTLPTNLYLGSYTANHANGLIDDLRISNIARTDAEILADSNSGVALPVDDYTTAKLNFDGNTLAEGYAKHTGDMWYAETAKLLKRYNGTTNTWDLVEDATAIDAYANASTAQDTADGKRRVFTAEPIPPYDVGDLWTGGVASDLRHCSTQRLTGAYNSVDWEFATFPVVNGITGFENGIIINASNQLSLADRPTLQGRHGTVEYTDAKTGIFNMPKSVPLGAALYSFRHLTIFVKNRSDPEKFLLYHINPYYTALGAGVNGFVQGINSDLVPIIVTHASAGTVIGQTNSTTTIGYDVVSADTAHRMSIRVEGIKTDGSLYFSFVGIDAGVQNLNVYIEWLLS